MSQIQFIVTVLLNLIFVKNITQTIRQKLEIHLRNI